MTAENGSLPLLFYGDSYRFPDMRSHAVERALRTGQGSAAQLAQIHRIHLTRLPR